MKIKKLTLHGFKSFPDKTEIELDAPITALVGPNGCGKSNVVDAIKWVLGSQSPTSLRGEQMSDVIFKGSSSRKPIGFAKAEFVIDNEDGEIPVDYSEVVVGRKLYRSGESVYMLNGEEVRLKDINELLYDTGIGVENYSLIEQGQIDRVLSSSATERRELLEEAAGISTFQARKREAERKLDRVEDDLERVHDLLGELKKEIHSLKTQAGKARKYKERRDELAEKKRLLHLDRYESLLEKEEELYEEWREAKEERSQVQSRMTTVREDAQEVTQDLKERQEEVDDLTSKRDRAERKISDLENEIGRIQDRLENINEERNRLSEQRLDELAERVEELEEEIEEAERERSRKRETKQELDGELEELRAKIEEFESGLADLEEQERELNEKKERVQNDLEEKVRELDRTGDRLERLEENAERDRRELDELEAEEAKQEQERSELGDRIAEKRETIEQRRGDLALLRNTKIRKKKEKQTVESTLAEHRSRLETVQSELQYLRSLEEKQAGLSDATRAVLKTFDPDAADNDVHGLLGEDLDFTELGHETIQGPLEPYLTYVVVEDWDTARQVSRVARESEGHAGVLVRTAFERRSGQTNVMWESIRRRTARGADDRQREASTEEPTGPVRPSVPSAPERGTSLRRADQGTPAAAGRSYSLNELVESDPARLRMVRELLRAQGIEEPIRESEQTDAFPGSGSSVQRKGLVTSDRGMVFIRGERRPEESIVDRRQKMEEYRAERDELKEKIEGRQKTLDQIQTGLDAVEQSMKACRTKIYETQVDVESLEERIEWLDEQLDVNRKEQELLESNLSEYREERERLKEKRDQLGEVKERLEEHVRNVEEKRENLTEQKRKARSRLEGFRDEKQQLNVQRAQLEEQIENASDLIRRHRSDLEKTEDRIASLRDRMKALERKRDENIEKLEDRRAQKVKSKNNLETLQDRVEKKKAEKKDLEERRDELRQKTDRVRQAYHDLKDEVSELKVHYREAESNRENLEERAREQLDTDLSEAVESYDGDDASFDREQLETEVRDLEKKVDRMGNVNLAALEQLEEKQERAEEIEEQEEDLKTSRQRLQRIIRKMKNESRKRFKDTLEQGKENFNKLFRKLFGGGKATLEAVYDEDEESEDGEGGDASGEDGSRENADLLDCGIEIYAKPPGKEMSKLSLLSGGERAMTSLALMMALFMLNPSAICILDEADAPLDESNLDLFIGLLNEFTDLTQFLIITHKKKTIAAADQVYGLTMQEDGVSQLVSLDLEKRIPEEYIDEEPERSSVAGTFRE